MNTIIVKKICNVIAIAGPLTGAVAEAVSKIIKQKEQA